MRRYLPLLLIAFFLTVVLIAGTTFLSGYAGKQNPENIKTVVLYTTLPVEQVAMIAQEYEKASGIRVSVMPLTPDELITKAMVEKDTPKADILLTNRQTLEQAKKAGLLKSYASEQTDIIPERFCDDEDFWTGVWYDPVVFAANIDYLKTAPQKPTKWADLAKSSGGRLAITDLLAAEASANLFYTMIQVNGEKDAFAFFDKIHPRIVQYAKFLNTPPRMAGMGEADIAIAVQSEAVRYIKDGFPLKIIYPEEGTAYLLSGIGLIAKAPHEIEAKHFFDWMLQDSCYDALYKNRFFVVPTNNQSKVYKELVKEFNDTKRIKLWDYENTVTNEQKAKLLDKWVQTVRLSPRQ